MQISYKHYILAKIIQKVEEDKMEGSPYFNLRTIEKRGRYLPFCPEDNRKKGGGTSLFVLRTLEKGGGIFPFVLRTLKKGEVPPLLS